MSTVDEIVGFYHMKVKGWAASNEKPSEDISKDGFSVSFAGMNWMCEIDAYSTLPTKFEEDFQAMLNVLIRKTHNG